MINRSGVYTGCPTKHDNSKTTRTSSLIFEFTAFFCQPNFRSKILDTHKILLVLVFPKCALLFYAFNITKEMKNFVQISTILLLFNKIEI